MARSVNSLFKLLVLLALLSAGGAGAQGASPGVPLSPGFDYQGRLALRGLAATGDCDLQFTLWNAAAGGAQLGGLQQLDHVAVSGGRFTVRLNESGEFGASAFDGGARWLGIVVRCPAGAGDFTALAPRQPVDAAPTAQYALRSGGVAGSPYAGVIVVAASGGDFTSIQSALDSVTASETQRYLVAVAPGVYTETVTMKPYVDIAGAGENATRIVSAGMAVSTTGTVVGASYAELSSLTIENTGGGLYSIGIYNEEASPRLAHVTVITHRHISIAILNRRAAPVMRSVSVRALGGVRTTSTGIQNEASSPDMQDVIAYAGGAVDSMNYGVANFDGSTPVMRDVLTMGFGGDGGIGVHNVESSPELVHVVATGIGGDIVNMGIHNEYCAPTLTDVVVTSATGVVNVGMLNEYAAPVLRDVTLNVWGGTINNIGMESAYSAPQLYRVTVLVSGGGNAYGIWNEASTLLISGSTISATQSIGNNYGVYGVPVTGTYTVRIDGSRITGDTAAIMSAPQYTTLLGLSFVRGGLLGNGTYHCAGVYDDKYIFSAGPACPE